MSSPAHLTKHIPLLTYSFTTSTFHLTQLDNGVSNGTALWLGAQCLSLYLAYIQAKFKPSQPGVPLRVVELGSGIGLTALALSSLGWDVLATDTPYVVSSVLASNVQNNLAELPSTSGAIDIRVLDWTILPQHWTWDDSMIIASTPLSSKSSAQSHNPLNPPYDLICSADTIYTHSLVEPLFRTIHALCTLSVERSGSNHAPSVYLCIERRDSSLIDQALLDAKNKWGFSIDRVPHKKLAKALKKGGIKWPSEHWGGIEIWKLTLLRG